MDPEELDVRGFSPAGLMDDPLEAASANGNSFALDATKRTFVRVMNADAGAPRTVTITCQLPAGAVPVGTKKKDIVVVVPAPVAYDPGPPEVLLETGERWIGPIDPAYRDSAGLAQLTLDDETDVTLAVYAI
jgi:hypothetical protein